jgi:ATP-dependent exoDNAse (exonuclease V) alpha subunit
LHQWSYRSQAVNKANNLFYAAGQCASHTQFPLQNCFALTVHKTQSMTLPQISADLSALFSPGQAYVALSRCKNWNHIQITGLHRDAFITDPEVVEEYQRLENIASQSITSLYNI